MSWSDWFIPSGSQTSSEQQANYAKQKQQLQAALDKRQAAQGWETLDPDFSGNYDTDGTPLDWNGNRMLQYKPVSDQTLNQDQALLASQLEDQNAAAAQGLKEGAAEGLNNVLNAPGKVVGAVGQGAGQVLWGIIKGIPWWGWLVGIGALFIWMGGLSLLRGRLAENP